MLIEDGMVRFRLTVDGIEKRFAVDSLAAVTLADKLVAKHNLQTKPGSEGETYDFTHDFYLDIGAEFARAFSLPTDSSTIAMKLWMASQREVYGLKKNMSEPPESLAPTASTPSS